MSVSNILTLNKPMGPCLIKALYWIALVIILLGVLHGVARGVWIMTHQMPHQLPAVTQSSSTSSSTPNAVSPGSALDARQTMWHRHFGPGYGNRGFRGPGFRHFRPGGIHDDGPLTGAGPRGLVYIADIVPRPGHGDGCSHSGGNRKCDPGHEREEGLADVSPILRFLRPLGSVNAV